MDPYNLKRLNAARCARQAAVHVTDLGDGRDRVIVEGDPVAGVLGEAIAKALRSGQSASVEAEGRMFFLNVHLPPVQVVVIGAVHISQSLAMIARASGYDVTIIDPRTAFATAERFAGTEVIADWPEDVLMVRPLDAYMALAAVTHDPKIDDPAIVAALDAGCFYVGALGSRKTNEKRIERLTAAGVEPEAIARIRAPIGLDIKAANPGEIAISIMAQIIESFRRRGLGETDRRA